MYQGGYGFGNAAGQNFNGASPQQQQQAAQQQQMMYNQQQQQFAGMAPQGGFNPGANSQMMPGGMMQNAGMPHMGGNGQMPGYQQQQFAGAQYGQVAPSSMSPQNFPPNNFMMGGGGMQGFPMQQQGMPQQQNPQMMQRMPQQQQQQVNHPAMNQASTPQRPPSSAQGTPSNAMPPQQQGQFQPPQQQQPQQSQQQPQQQQQQGQTPNNFPQQQPEGMTPNTPTFPANAGAQQGIGSTPAAPMSPGAEMRDKQRFALLLDINHELLYESIQIQTSQQEIKKELAAEGKLTPDRKPTEEESNLQQDYIQCMRRLQANLSYMATLADRKPDTKLPSAPGYLTAPNLNLTIKLRAQPIVPEGGDLKLDPVTDREERDQSIKELYARLQACYPGIDPNKEPAFRGPAAGQKQGNPGLNQPSPTTHKTPQMSNMPAPPNQGGA